MESRKYVIFGLVLCVTGVILGAFAAHSLTSLLEESSIASFQTGVRYQMYHGLALIVVYLLSTNMAFRSGTISFLMALGTLCFSGSIYLLVLNNLWNLDFLKWLGPVTPIGGLLLILSWALLLLKVIQSKKY